MRSIEWHVLDGTGGKTVKAVRTLNVRSDGNFESSLPVSGWSDVESWAKLDE